MNDWKNEFDSRFYREKNGFNGPRAEIKDFISALLHSERQSILKAIESEKRESDPMDEFFRPCDCVGCIKNSGYNQALSDIATEIERRDK